MLCETWVAVPHSMHSLRILRTRMSGRSWSGNVRSIFRSSLSPRGFPAKRTKYLTRPLYVEALRIERDPKTAGEELRAQLRQALGNTSLFKERPGGGYMLTESDVTQGAASEGSLAV